MRVSTQYLGEKPRAIGTANASRGKQREQAGAYVPSQPDVDPLDSGRKCIRIGALRQGPGERHGAADRPLPLLGWFPFLVARLGADEWLARFRRSARAEGGTADGILLPPDL